MPVPAGWLLHRLPRLVRSALQLRSRRLRGRWVPTALTPARPWNLAGLDAGVCPSRLLWTARRRQSVLGASAAAEAAPATGPLSTITHGVVSAAVASEVVLGVGTGARGRLMVPLQLDTPACRRHRVAAGVAAVAALAVGAQTVCPGRHTCLPCVRCCRPCRVRVSAIAANHSPRPVPTVAVWTAAFCVVDVCGHRRCPCPKAAQARQKQGADSHRPCRCSCRRGHSDPSLRHGRCTPSGPCRPSAHFTVWRAASGACPALPPPACPVTTAGVLTAAEAGCGSPWTRCVRGMASPPHPCPGDPSAATAPHWRRSWHARARRSPTGAPCR